MCQVTECGMCILSANRSKTQAWLLLVTLSMKAGSGLKNKIRSSAVCCLLPGNCWRTGQASSCLRQCGVQARPDLPAGHYNGIRNMLSAVADNLQPTPPLLVGIH